MREVSEEAAKSASPAWPGGLVEMQAARWDSTPYLRLAK